MQTTIAPAVKPEPDRIETRSQGPVQVTETEVSEDLWFFLPEKGQDGKQQYLSFDAELKLYRDDRGLSDQMGFTLRFTNGILEPASRTSESLEVRLPTHKMGEFRDYLVRLFDAAIAEAARQGSLEVASSNAPV